MKQTKISSIFGHTCWCCYF